MAKSKAPEQTLEEVKYLQHLVDSAARIVIVTRNDDELTGVVEFYDAGFIRLNREDEPNLFVYKHDIKYFYELP